MNDSSVGALYATAAYGFWGLTPLYWKAVEQVPPPELLGHRILWSCAVGVALVSAARAWPELARCARTPREGLPILLASGLLSKLSYFLWNGPPDAITLKLAANNELSKRLDDEIARMIADSRFSRFTTEFATQWLALDKFAVLEPDRKRFPNGIRPISDYAHANGLKTVLWFEPERAFKGTPWVKAHPEWFLNSKAVDPDFPILLFNLGNPEARKWFIDEVSRRIQKWGVDCYRQDFNMGPLPFWHEADAPDRQGMTEIRYIEGLYEFWDELLNGIPA